MPSANIKCSSSKWRKLNVSDSDPLTGLKINDMKYCLSQRYGATFNEHEGSIICRVLDICEGVLARYSFWNITKDNNMFIDIFDTKIVDYYWIEADYLVLMLFNSLDQAIHHYGFKVDHEKGALLHSEEEKSISPLVFSDGTLLSNDEVDWKMPWNGGITPIFIRGESYILISTIERLVINKFKPDSNFSGRQILNLCTDTKEGYLCGATPFAYGPHLYFVLYQNEAHQAHNGEERRKLFVDRIACVDLSDFDVSRDELVITDEIVDFAYLPLTKRTKGNFYTTRDHEIRQQAQYLIISEKKISTRSKKRPAIKSRVFVIDMEKQTVLQQDIRMRSQSFATMLKDGFLVFRNKISVDGSALEFKIEPIKTNTTMSLVSTAFHKFIMTGTLPQSHRHLFF